MELERQLDNIDARERSAALAELLESKLGDQYQDKQDMPDFSEKEWAPYRGVAEINQVLQGHGLEPAVKLEPKDIGKLCLINPIVHRINGNDHR